MTPDRPYIAGDWGTSHLRLFLCSGGRVLQRCEGPGVAQLSAAADPARFSQTLRELTAPWVQAHGAVPVWLSGMVGSRTGWREAPYVPCPADVSSFAASMLRFVADAQKITIAPGLLCTNPRGAPDVLRGEETQIIGAFARHPALAQGRQVLALPGTHAKWVLVEDGRIVSFQTSLTGELYALLRDHSTLARASSNANAGTDSVLDDRAFQQGIARVRDLRTTPLQHLVFETRSRQLVGGMSRPEALAFLSGLMIGQDVEGAIGLFDGAPARGACVPLIGAPRLTELYRIALASHGVDVMVIDASEATLSGLQAFAAMAERMETTRALGH